VSRAAWWTLGALAAPVALGWVLWLAAEGSPGGPPAALAGGLLAGVAGAAGLAWALHARNKAKKAFISAVFGGMLLRLLVYGMALVAVHLAGSWSLGWFVGGVLGGHFAAQVIEITCLMREPAPTLPGEGGPRDEGRTGGD
jgi:hypothetical protein